MKRCFQVNGLFLLLWRLLWNPKLNITWHKIVHFQCPVPWKQVSGLYLSRTKDVCFSFVICVLADSIYIMPCMSLVRGDSCQSRWRYLRCSCWPCNDATMMLMSTWWCLVGVSSAFNAFQKFFFYCTFCFFCYNQGYLYVNLLLHSSCTSCVPDQLFSTLSISNACI